MSKSGYCAALMLAAGLALTVPQAAGQVSGGRAAGPLAGAQPESAADQEREPIRKRLLTLQGGLVLRGTTRFELGRWSWKRDGEWTPLPLGAVVSARTEKEALAELSKRRQPLRKAAAALRVPLVEWMLQTGLYTEALGELDRMLGEAPDDPAVLALLARNDLPVRVPAWSSGDAESMKALLDYAARSPASLQEMVVRELEPLPLAELRELQPLLTAGLTSRESQRRRFSVLALRRLFPGFSVNELTRRAVLDPVEEVRVQSALALRDTGEESVIDPLARALGSSSSVVRTHAAQSLGLTGFAAAVEPLALRLMTLAPSGGGGQVAPRGTIFVGRQIAYVQDFDPEVATNATIADPIIGTIQEGVTLDVKIFGSSGGGYTFAHETRHLRRSLSRLTGADVKDTNGAWKHWWNTVGQEWVQAHRKAVEAVDARLAGTTAGKREG
jgi:hypothetical protein